MFKKWILWLFVFLRGSGDGTEDHKIPRLWYRGVSNSVATRLTHGIGGLQNMQGTVSLRISCSHLATMRPEPV